MMLFDLHLHSNHSDGIPGVRDIESYCKREQIGIALTDHNEIRGSVKLLANDQIPCLPGVEVGTLEGLEFLIYFADPSDLEDFYVHAVEPYLLSRFMSRSKCRSVATLEAARERNAFVSLAHPYAFGRKSLEHHRKADGRLKAFVHEVFERIDAVEQFNGGIPRKANVRSADLHLELEKKITVGSDAHTLAKYGSAGVYVPSGMSARGQEMFDAVASNRFSDTKQESGAHMAKLLPLIAYKHTKFFLTKRNGKN